MNEFSEDQRYGSSRFAVEAEIAPLLCKQQQGKPRLYLGLADEVRRILRHPSDAPALMVAGSGAGKAVSGGILYNACSYPGSMLITDFKGEIASVSLIAQAFMGKHAYCVNPMDLLGLPNHSTDPLDILTPDSKTLVPDAKMIAEMLVPFTSGKDGLYFQEMARLLIEAILLADVENGDG